jgi:transcriptional regulator with PAS, ATPase and Fis domain
MAADEFRWQSLFQHSSDPVFVLSRRRRLLFVNKAWEALTGHTVAAVRGLACTRRSSEGDLAYLAHCLCPTADVMQGRFGRVSRPLPGKNAGPPWWEIEFLPLTNDSDVIAVIGKIKSNGASAAGISTSIPESWTDVRSQATERFRLDLIDADRQPTLVAQSRLAASGACPVYILGEPGTGKRWLARAIHNASDRRESPFFGLDCFGLPPAALRAAICGLKAGTLYLHEPSELPRELQADLSHRIVDDAGAGPRIIAGSTASDDPKRPVFLGQMLPELYDTLAVLVIPLPPLRARKEELTRLVDGMLKRATAAIGKTLTSLSADAWDCMRTYNWPGNLRELYATLFQAGRRTANAEIATVDLPLSVRQARPAAVNPLPAPQKLPALDNVLEEVERRMIRLALEKADGNQSKAADLLAVWRPRLIRRIKALGLDQKTI